MFDMPAVFLCDFYKLAHREQYPNKTEKVYSTWIPRSNRHHDSVDKVVVFGFQGFIKQFLIDYFNKNFFSRNKEKVITEYKRFIKYTLFVDNPETKHIEDLYDLGHLPVIIKAMPEGSLCPIRMPMLVIENTDSRFFWITNYLETLMSTEFWPASTAATIAKEYRDILDNYCEQTGGDKESVAFQGHDFSMRGLLGVAGSGLVGPAHLLSFVGTDTAPSIFYLEKYYNADIERELVGVSVAASEHSVMCAGGADDEYETYRRLIEDVYPSGIVSIVSDTWDLWYVLSNIIPRLKDKIMTRDGKVVIRPDSGDPVDIICGLENKPGFTVFERDGELRVRDNSTGVSRVVSKYEVKGVIEVLWDIFGGTTTDKGYKVLDSHIGAIYGDAITLERAKQICERLMKKGFASTNMVLGIGSYTYQYNTRDTFGFALKSTWCQIDGEEKLIFKDPVTDNGTKKSLVGKVVVRDFGNGELVMFDNLTSEQEMMAEGKGLNMLRPIFKDGKLLIDDSLSVIRERLRGCQKPKI